jgi:hypothetical protein
VWPSSTGSRPASRASSAMPALASSSACAVAPIARAWVQALSTNNFRPMLAVARRIAPETADVLEQHLTAGPPALHRTTTPSEARERLAARA